jgi:hypothetical protein
MFYVFLGMFVAYCTLMAISWRRRKLFWWPIERRLIGIAERREGDARGDQERRQAPERRGTP